MQAEVRIVNEDEPLPIPPECPALTTGFQPDRFQAFAIEAIEAGDNVLVTAKTGSGKTFVGEYQIAKSLKRGGRVFYTTPIKSLSNQKFYDLKQLFPEASVGILTGDIKFCPDADIVILTTEILRNLLFKRGTATESVGMTSLLSLDRLDAVIFDEVHYINDPDRGHIWEETLILLPPEVKLILLSATLSAPEPFAHWLAECKRRKVWLIRTLWRAVPLEHCVISRSGEFLPILTPKEVFQADVYRSWLADREGILVAHDKFKEKVKSAKQAGQEGPVGGKVRPKAFEHQMNECLEKLHTTNGLPAICFVFSRKGCESLAKTVTGTYLDNNDSANVNHIWNFHLSRYRKSLEISPQANALKDLAMRGIAYHHSGLLPFLKEILEILFSRGLIKVLFATETFAVGINMPTKTVLFTALEKFTDGTMRHLHSSEYIQMAGRAGRRGKDAKGTVLYLPRRDPLEVFDIQRMMTGKAASFQSRMNFHYDFVLKLLNTGRSLSELLEGSYWFALQDSERRMWKKDLDTLEKSIQEIPLTQEQHAACEERYTLQQTVETSYNSKKKIAMRNLQAWKDEHKDSIWNPLMELYMRCKELHISAEKIRTSLLEDTASLANSSVSLRRNVLVECGFVDSSTQEWSLLPDGRLASEVNEGHPFLMTTLLKRCISAPPTLVHLLQILATFVAEKGDRSEVEQNKSPDSLDVDPYVKEALWKLDEDAKEFQKKEKLSGLPSDPDYWALSTEWIEPLRTWVEHPDEPLASVASKHELFEGTFQKAIFKLAALVEEFQAMASLCNAIDLLRVLEGSRPLILHDVVIAESLYLRLT